MKIFMALVCTLLITPAFSGQIIEQPGTSFGSNVDEKNSPAPEDKTWGWNNDSDYDVGVTFRTDRFKGPGSGSGHRVQVNRGTPIRIDNTYKPVNEPPDVNSGLTQPTKN